MRRLMILLLCVVCVGGLTACRGQMDADAESVSETQRTDMKEETSTKTADDSQNILIAYFTWADNTQVENPEEVDVDADTSASVLAPGNAAKIADWIHQRTGGDLFSIVVEEPYSSDYDECLERAADEKAENARPELVSHVENMEDYDVVFLGFPKMEQGYICV